MKKLFAIVIGIMMIFGCTAFADGGNYLFVQTEDGIYISAYDGNETLIVLPESFKGQPVVGVGEGAFKGNRSIKEVIVPDSYRVIGMEAFADCTSLRDVYFGSGLELIDERAFAGCVDLLSISAVQKDYETASTAFDEDKQDIPCNGADIMQHLSQCGSEDYALLYIAACDMMSRGQFEEARDVFLSLYGYELSADYYFYCSARLYERRGDIDAALAIYALTPDLNDCGERLAYYKGEKEVASFFRVTEYTRYFEYYFGENGSYSAWNDIAAAGQTEVGTESEAIIGGADEPTDIIVGSSIEAPEATEAPAAPEEEQTASEPVDEPEEVSATVEPNPALMSYHDYTGDMPYSFDDRSKSDGYYSLYFYYEDAQQINDYAALFEAQGWEIIRESDSDGWEYMYVVDNANGAYFMMGYTEAEKLLVIMYESGLPYTFDPVNGL